MEKVIDILIPVLMFCVPLAASLIAKANEKKKKALKEFTVTTQPLTVLEDDEEDDEDDVEEEEVAPVAMPYVAPAPAPVPAPEVFTEGEHAIKHTARKADAAKAEKKEKIDTRKLIIYSELMKPKFNEGLE